LRRESIMSVPSENESWVVERGGDIVEKEARVGAGGLSDWERLVYCLWVADYMMRNAGDFANAAAMYPTFQRDAKQLAQRHGLTVTYEAFSLSKRRLQTEYFDRFEGICDEIRSAEPKLAT
jgi:hypothetical protein